MTNVQAAMPPMPPKTKEIFGIVYRFRQKYQHPVNTTEFWERCAADAGEICKHFGNDPLCIDLIVACYTDIERELKGERMP